MAFTQYKWKEKKKKKISVEGFTVISKNKDFILKVL